MCERGVLGGAHNSPRGKSQGEEVCGHHCDPPIQYPNSVATLQTQFSVKLAVSNKTITVKIQIEENMDLFPRKNLCTAYSNVDEERKRNNICARYPSAVISSNLHKSSETGALVSILQIKISSVREVSGPVPHIH